jgi:hypothetical protein
MTAATRAAGDRTEHVMRFLESILCRGPETERYRRAVAQRRYGVGDGIEAVDVVLYGPVVLRPSDRVC